MGIGIGILLLVIGLILAFAWDGNLPMIEDDTLGWIFIVVGALSLVLSLVMQSQRRRSHHTTEVIDDAPRTTRQVRRDDRF